MKTRFYSCLLSVSLLMGSASAIACDDGTHESRASHGAAASHKMTLVSDVPDASITTANSNTGADAVPPPPMAVEGSVGGHEGHDMQKGDAMVAPSPKACPHQDWVGKKVSDIDMKPIKTPIRVLSPNGAATMDYNPDRLNVIRDEKTDLILEVRCG